MPKTTLQPWENKIVGYGSAPVSQIKANVHNWRKHPQQQMGPLSGVLHEVGIVQNIVINRRTSSQWGEPERNKETLVDGHARVALALQKGQESLPATYVDLTPGEEAEILALLDPLAALAESDKSILNALLQDVQSGDAAIQQMLEGLAVQQSLIPPPAMS
ncbi:MAG: hypothetical protein AABZ55_11785, partial [Bdellovibrionota bacterium]